MLDNAEVERRLDQATAYFEAEDNDACKSVLLLLLSEPGVDLADRFTAQVQLVYNAQSWREGERYRKEAKATFAEMSKDGAQGSKQMLDTFRFVLDDLVDWQNDVKESTGGVSVAKTHITKLRQQQR